MEISLNLLAPRGVATGPADPAMQGAHAFFREGVGLEGRVNFSTRAYNNGHNLSFETDMLPLFV